MEFIGEPISIQNSSEGWLVTWNDAVRVTTQSGAELDRISFTVLVPGKAETSVHELQVFALQRALKLLQERLRHASP